MDIQRLVLAGEQLDKQLKRLDDPTIMPYYYKVTSKSQTLYFIGVRHTGNSNDPQIPVLHKLWTEFVRKTHGHKRLLMVEGKPQASMPSIATPTNESLAELLGRDGERGYMIELAAQAGIPYYSPEPNRTAEMIEIAKHTGKEQLLYYYFVRQAIQWHRRKLSDTFDVYVQQALDAYKYAVDWIDFDFSINHMVHLHNQWHDHQFHPDDVACFNRDSSPTSSRVAALSMQFRDIHIVSGIQKQWNHGNNVFVVFGGVHAIKLEPALKQLLA